MVNLLCCFSCFCPAFALPVSIYGLKRCPERWKQFSALFAFFFAVIAYNYYPIYETDLMRYYAVLSEYSNMGLIEVILNDRSRLYILDIWFWLISQSANYHLLPATSTFCVYFIGAYISNYYFVYLEENVNDAIWHLFFLICCLDLTIVVNYVRNIMAFSIVLFGAFRILEEKKKNIISFILLIMPIWIHSTSIIFLLAVLIAPIIKRHKLSSLLVAIFTSSIVTAAYMHMNSVDLPYEIRGVITKAYKYLNNEVASGWVMQVDRAFTSQLVKYYNIGIVIFIMLLFLFWEYSNSYNINYGNFRYIVYSVGMCTLCSLYIIAPVYRRFYSAFILGAAAILCVDTINIWIKYVLYMVSCVGIIKSIFSMSYEIQIIKLGRCFYTNFVEIAVETVLAMKGIVKI